MVYFNSEVFQKKEFNLFWMEREAKPKYRNENCRLGLFMRNNEKLRHISFLELRF